MARTFRKNKYKAVRTNGFSSKLESAVFDLLKLKQMAGEISDIKCQQSVVLVEGRPGVRIAWKVDFSYIDVQTQKLVYVEAKGVETSDYKLKLKLYRANRSEPLYIYKGTYPSSGVKLYLHEFIPGKE